MIKVFGLKSVCIITKQHCSASGGKELRHQLVQHLFVPILMLSGTNEQIIQEEMKSQIRSKY